MNYENKAEEIVSKADLTVAKNHYRFLTSLIVNALREAAGETIEHEFKLWDRVLFSDNTRGTITFLHVHKDSVCYVVAPGTEDITINCEASDLRIDPEFANPLYFKPIVEGQKFKNGKYYFLYSDGRISKSLSHYAGEWVDAVRYAEIPEGWGE